MLTTSFRSEPRARAALVPCQRFRSALALGRRRKVILAFLLLASPASAALDPGLKTPYQLRLVLHIADNRFLTPIFEEQMERELRDLLQLSYGALAKVEVVRSHPLLREVLAKGLQQALDGWEELSGSKTHFVLLDYVNGRYELQARQHDGKTGLNSPVVRRGFTSDRRLVAQQAARLVDRDFGLVGTVVKTGAEVHLAVQGGGLGVPLQRWIQPGEVFAIARVTHQAGKLRADRLPWALLQVIDQPRDGICRCRFYHRFQQDHLGEGGTVLGHRCLKLATITAPLRLSLIDEKTFQPLDGLQVHVSREFDSKPRELTTDRDGLAITKEEFTHVAFVRVIKGETRARFPVEIVDDDRPAVCRLRLGDNAESLEALEFRKDLWVRRIYDELRLASDRVLELHDLLGKSLESALLAAREGLEHVKDEQAALKLEHNLLQRQAAGKQLPKGLDLREGEQRLEELSGRHKELEGFITRLEAAIKEEQSDRTRDLRKLLERARLLETEAEFAQALVLYTKFLKESPKQPKVQSRVDKLKKDWALKSPDHAQAREFVYQAWPKLDVGGLKAGLPEAKKAFELCRKSGDALTPRKLLRANVVHAANLKNRLGVLKRLDTEDNRAEAKTIGQVAEDLRRLHAEVAAFVEQMK